MDKEQKITNDIKVQNKDLEILKKHFSHCFDKNGNFDIEKFKQQLSENEIDFYKESYSMDWLGKSYARLLASDSATTLLREDEEFNQKEENKNAENLLIKGDNLEVLKHLSNAYYEKIKMIYIDPPYNTGKDDFVYQDNRKFTLSEFRQLAGVDEDKAKRILSFVDSKSNSHSAWLTFMYPRLYIAKQLLKDDGVIFVSIDDNEVAQLRLLMDEIFGEENFVAEFVWRKKTGANDAKDIATITESILLYVKNHIVTIENKIWSRDENSINQERYQLSDEFVETRGKYYLDTLDRGGLQYSDSMNFGIEAPDGGLIFPNGRSIFVNDGWIWKWGKDKIKWGIENKFLEFVESDKSNGSKYTIKYKVYQNVDNKGNIRQSLGRAFSNLITEPINQQGNSDFARLFDGKKYFSNPKPIGLISYFVKTLTEQNHTILDFFAGSGTTGDAVMQLNAEDGGNRKYILVQLPEPIDPKKNKTAYDFVKDELRVEEPTIFEITKERLIRASKKIKEETLKTKITEKDKEIKDLDGQLDIDNKDEKTEQLKSEIKALKNQDLGFKVFETMPIWEDYDFEADKLQPEFEVFDESKLSEDDLKALLVTWKTYDGISLTENLQEIDLGGYIAYYTSGKLYLMNKGFKTENLKALLEKIDSDKKFNPTSIIAFGYHFESKNLREISENIKSYANKKNIDIDFITRY